MDSNIKVIIDHQIIKSVYWGGKFLDTNTEIDLSFSDALRLSRIYKVKFPKFNLSYDPQHWKEKRFGITGDADAVSGFGNCTINLIKYSERAGYDVRWIGRQMDVAELNHLFRKQIPNDIGMVWHDQPRDFWLETPFKKNIAIIPFETTRIPGSWVPKINTFDALFVPCRQNIQMMQDSGVKIPVELIHWGVDPNKFYPLERNNTVFTFGIMGALSVRKGIDILVDAFVAAFPRHLKDVKLIVKTSYNVYPFMVKDPRIEVQMTPVSHQELLDNFVRKIDCFVFPTRGEGAGLPPLEMAATGVPTIVTGWSGPADYMCDAMGWSLDYTMEPAENFSKMVYKENCGVWAKPKIDDLVEKMRYAYSHQDEVKERGAWAAEYIKRYWLWEQRIGEFLTALDKHL